MFDFQDFNDQTLEYISENSSTMKFILSLLLSFSIILFSCSSSKTTDNEDMQKAFKIHTESSQIEEALKPKLDQLVQIKNSTNIVGRALTPAEIETVEKIEKIETSLKFWQENLPDVPGFEHEHKAHEGPCNHGPKLELMPEDWVRVQQEFKDSILVIKSRVEEVLNG